MDPSLSPARSPETELTGRQRRHLRALAHHIVPVVIVGKDGVTDGVAEASSRALADHELIKVRVLETAPQQASETGAQLAQALGAHLAGRAGRIVILYRRNEDDPQIRLPS